MSGKKPKTFIRKYSEKFEAEIAQKKKARRDRIGKTLGKTSNLSILLFTFTLIFFLFKQRIATPILTSQTAVGENYFNALTLARFITDYLPSLPTGWIPLWNTGIPLIDSTPTLFFYAVKPLTNFLDLATSLELTALFFLLVYLLCSHLLFWQLSKKHLFSLILTGILFVTPATYQLLILKGDFSASSIQWILPLILILLTHYIKTRKRQLLILSAILTGFALITHPALALTAVMLPSILYLVIIASEPEGVPKLNKSKTTIWTLVKTKLILFFTYISISLVIAAPGLKTLFSKTNRLETIPCTNSLCWGEYPKELIWFSPLILAPILAILPAGIIALSKQKAGFNKILSWLAAFLALVSLAAVLYSGMLDPLANFLLPRELFWSIVLLALALLATCLNFTHKISNKLATTATSITIVALALALPLLPEVTKFNIKNISSNAKSYPAAAETYIVPKYASGSKTAIVPDWLPLNDSNTRIDSVTPEFTAWWNTISDIPSTRSFLVKPDKDRLTWQHYLHFTTAPADLKEEISDTVRLNRALFMLDAFAVKFIQHPSESIAFQPLGYNPTLLVDPTIVKQRQIVLGSNFIELQDNLTTPIVFPTNAPRILVISNQTGYQSFVRAISLLNLNSSKLITIKGPQSIDEIDRSMLENSDAVLLYQFTGTDWSKIKSFLENGGNLYAEITSDFIPDNLPDFIGVKKLKPMLDETNWNLTYSPSKLLANVNLQNFSPPLYGENPWKMVAPSLDDLQSFMQPVLIQKGNSILASGEIKDAKLIFSGFNLPYHLVRFQNDEELRLFKNILNQILPKLDEPSQSTVERPNPANIIVTTQNSRGIYFKENHHPGWKANINGQPAPVYKAGLDFMYIPIPERLQDQQTEIIIRFKGDKATWIPVIMTFAGLAFALTYSLTTTPFEKLQKLIKVKITRPIKLWWKKE